MKRIFKILAYFILTTILLIIVLLVVAKLAENKITDIALKKVSESIEAPVNIDEVSLNLLRKFPLATIELNDVILNEHILTGDSISSSSLDTIANIKKLFVSVKSKPLINGIIEIMKVDIDGATINYRVDTSGTTNIDFLIASSDTIEVADTLPSKPLNLTLTDLTVKNIVCNFIDSSFKTAAHVLIPDLKVNAKLDRENIIASAKGGISLSDCSFDNTNLYLMNNTDINFDIDYENDSITVKDLLIQTDGANLGLSGHVVLGDTIKSDVQFSGTELILGELIKYAPKELLKEFGVDKLSGIMNLDATVKGSYSKTEMPQVNLNISFRNGNIITKDYPELKNISFNGKLTNGILRNNQSTQADFSSFHFETDKSKFDLTFLILDIDKPKYNVKTDFDVNISEFTNYIPDSLFEYIDGNINASLTTKGELPDSIGDDFVDYLMENSIAEITFSDIDVEMPDVSVKDFSMLFKFKPNNVSIQNLNVDVPTYNIDLRNTYFNTSFYGSINDIPALDINVKEYYLETKGANISGNLKVKNLDNPIYDTRTIININLADTKSLLPDSLISDLSGKLVMDIISSASLNMDSIADEAMEALFNSSTINVSLNNIKAVSDIDPLYNVENLYGAIGIDPKGIKINNLKGTALGIDFLVDSTKIWNIYDVIFKKDSTKFLTAQSNISIGNITNDFIGNFLSSDSLNKATDTLTVDPGSSVTAEAIDTIPKDLLPNFAELGIPHFLVRGKIDINQVEYEKNIVDDISLKFRFTDSLYVIEHFKLNTCGGEINTSILLNARGRFWEKPVLDIRNHITNLDLNEFLLKNDKYVQEVGLTHENLSGILTSEFDTRIFIEEVLKNNTNKIRAQGHFTLEKGKLYNFEPLVEASIGIGGLKELDRMEFQTLNISFFMFKDKIFIPRTNVVSNALDLSAFAMHGLRKELGYEYHLVIHPGDVLKGKSDKLMEEQAKQAKKNGEVADRSGLNLVSLKYPDRKRNGWDTKALKDDFNNKLNVQKGFLKLLFYPMLVNFSTDFDRTAKHKEIIEKYGTGNSEE